MNSEDLLKKAFRVCTIFWLLGWYLKVPFQFPLFQGDLETPFLTHSLFPELFRDSRITLVAYFLPVLSIGVFLFRSWKCYLLSAALLALCSLCLLLHIDTYNDATHNTSFWCGIWLIFLCVIRNHAHASTHIVTFGHLIVGMIFLGGFVGKLTSGYWDGTALYHIYFLQKANFPYPYFREHFTLGEMQNMAYFLSRGAIFGEFVLACAPFIPSRFLLPMGIAIMLFIVGVSHYYLFSVMACLIGMIAGTYLIAKEEQDISS